MNTKLFKEIQQCLHDLAPKMQFTVDFTNPRSRYTENFRTVLVGYNEEIAKERGLKQPAMRAAIKSVLAQTAVYHELESVAFEPWVPKPIRVNADRTTELVDDLRDLASRITDPGLLVAETLTLAAGHLDRRGQAVLDAALVALGSPRT